MKVEVDQAPTAAGTREVRFSGEELRRLPGYEVTVPALSAMFKKSVKDLVVQNA